MILSHLQSAYFLYARHLLPCRCFPENQAYITWRYETVDRVKLQRYSVTMLIALTIVLHLGRHWCAEATWDVVAEATGDGGAEATRDGCAGATGDGCAEATRDGGAGDTGDGGAGADGVEATCNSGADMETMVVQQKLQPMKTLKMCAARWRDLRWRIVGMNVLRG
jgi:hypothetical protein